MKIRNCHERTVAAPPEAIAALIADLDRVWPTDIAPAPRRQGQHTYDAGLMLWEEFDRPGAARAFRVVRPDGLAAEHWFELEPADGATVLRHTIEGSAAGRYEEIWRERIEPFHDLILEALLDNVEAAAGNWARTPQRPCGPAPGADPTARWGLSSGQDQFPDRGSSSSTA
jgi:hypothetical protein